MAEQIVINRDVEARVIPEGNLLTIPSGTSVTITQQLGGTFTVVSQFGMSRIAGADADALGLDIPNEAQENPEKIVEAAVLQENSIWEQLKTVYDPEIPVNIVDLGLVYSCDSIEQSNGTHHVDVKMTLTAPGCGMGPVIADDARSKIMSLPGVAEANVDIVWDPPWNQDMITEEGRMILGLV
ncbi:MAG: putative Fe-S cluster assembly protein SufT [Verrucomicrobia bacterium]|nr:putative Fe-S cluster assembly protein SufT [Verrucomicrobiota bacterium]MDA1066788.1 putative Fe-S cluster assembly protein SufT [Verrucomicrobiota bacterium]